MNFIAKVIVVYVLLFLTAMCVSTGVFKSVKPNEEIIENIGDTVEVVTQIKPIYNIKASE